MANTPDLDLDQLRERWVHEDRLLNQRLTWLFVGQSILFATRGAIAQASASDWQIQTLLAMLPLVGVASAVLIGSLVVHGLFAQEHLKNCDERVQSKPGASGCFGWAASTGLPLVFVVAWGVIGLSDGVATVVRVCRFVAEK